VALLCDAQLDTVMKLSLFQCETEKEDPFFNIYVPVCAIESTDFQQGFILWFCVGNLGHQEAGNS